MAKNGDDALAVRLVAACRERGVTLATAESCTGGLIAERLTSVSGASAVFLGGVVSYANTAKQVLLGVPQTVFERVGAVSAECAEGMADGVRQRLGADLAVSVTGIAGPEGGTPDKPVGLVYIGVASSTGVQAECYLFAGDREAVRRQAADAALARLLERVER